MTASKPTPDMNRALRVVTESETRFYETPCPEGFRDLCDAGILTELEARPSCMGSIFRFELTLLGAQTLRPRAAA